MKKLFTYLIIPLLIVSTTAYLNSAPYVSGGAGGGSGATINDSAGNGDTTEVWSADKVFDELALKAPLANGTHTGATTLNALLFSTAQAITEVSDAVSGVTASKIVVTSQAGVTDTLSGITCTGTCPSILQVFPAAGHTITVTDTASTTISIPMGSNITLVSTGQPYALFLYDYLASKYVAITRPDIEDISGMDLSATTAGTVIPWSVGTASAPTGDGQAYWNSSTKVLTIGDGAAAQRVPMNKAAVALTSTGGAIPLTVGSRLYTYAATDNEDTTITFSGAGNAGDEITIIFKTGTSSADEIITFEATLVSSTGTLTLADADDKFYVIRFVSDGSHWYEVSRTAVQT